MSKQGQTHAQKFKAERLEQYRDYLSEKCRLEHVIANIEKMESLELESAAFMQIKAANEQRIKLINKYCPDARDVQDLNVTGEMHLTHEEWIKQLS